MSDTSSKTPKAPPAPKDQAAAPKPTMTAVEKLIGKSIIGSGVPNNTDRTLMSRAAHCPRSTRAPSRDSPATLDS